MNPWQWNDEIQLWENVETGETMTVEEWDVARCRRIAQLEAELRAHKENEGDECLS